MTKCCELCQHYQDCPWRLGFKNLPPEQMEVWKRILESTGSKTNKKKGKDKD